MTSVSRSEAPVALRQLARSQSTCRPAGRRATSAASFCCTWKAALPPALRFLLCARHDLQSKESGQPLSPLEHREGSPLLTLSAAPALLH